MNEKFTDQHTNRFFNQLKKLDDYYKIEKARQIINDPKAKATLRGKKFKPLKFIIMTISLAFPVIFLFVLFQPQNDSLINKKTSHKKEQKTTIQDQIVPKRIIHDTISKENELIEVSQKKEPFERFSKKENTLKVMNGNNHIVELTIDEMEQLGFSYSGYELTYVNSFDSLHVIYDGSSLTNTCSKEAFKKDTFTYVNARFYNNSRYNKGEATLINKVYKWGISKNNYYPNYITNLNGDVVSKITKNDFELCNDTLLPILINSNTLDIINIPFQNNIPKPIISGRFGANILWFNTTKSLFQKLPDRYKYLELEYEKIREQKKCTSNLDLVIYDFIQWEKENILILDSVINGKDLVISPTDKELLNAGFKKDELGWYFVDSYSISPIRLMDGNIDTIKNYDNKIAYISDVNGNLIPRGYFSSQIYFKYNINFHVPVKVPNNDGSYYYYWFKPTLEFWKSLPQRYQDMKSIFDRIAYTKQKYPNKKVVNYFEKGRIYSEGEINCIILNKEELEKLGFEFNMDHVSLTCEMNHEGLLYFHRPGYLEAIPYPKDSMNHKNVFHILYITDIQGFIIRDVYSKTRLQLENEKILNYLIPIYVPFADIISPEYKNQVLWFTPTEDFFDRLPIEMGKSMKTEYSNLDNKDISLAKTCTYFEACKSTLELNNFKLYPNPTNTITNIEFSTINQLRGEIVLTNVSGVTVKTLLNDQIFLAGDNYFELNLSDVKPGIYIVMLITDQGFKTQRIIVNQ